MTIYQQYAELEKQIKELEAKKKELREQVQAELEASEAKTIKTEFATFSLAERKKWIYSNKVKELEKDLKTVKKQEETDGTATYEITKSLRVQLA